MGTLDESLGEEAEKLGSALEFDDMFRKTCLEWSRPTRRGSKQKLLRSQKRTIRQRLELQIQNKNRHLP